MGGYGMSAPPKRADYETALIATRAAKAYAFTESATVVAGGGHGDFGDAA
jgi:hypothetical protein